MLRLGLGTPASAGARRVMERPEMLKDKAKHVARAHDALLMPDEEQLTSMRRQVRPQQGKQMCVSDDLS